MRTIHFKNGKRKKLTKSNLDLKRLKKQFDALLDDFTSDDLQVWKITNSHKVKRK